ncbi:hypothetical protein ACE83Q_00610 [Dellaglioa sp. P0083]|uniref:hypothetical protein n=1 Tax=Dellaglioa kimchii TaxID=3344667 RepID=UPI0038D368ED
MIRKVINSKIIAISLNIILMILAIIMIVHALSGKFYSENVFMVLVGAIEIVIILLQSKLCKYRGIIILSIFNVILNVTLSNLVYTDPLIWACYIGSIISIFFMIKFPKMTSY